MKHWATIKKIFSLSDADLKLVKEQIDNELKRRVHKGEPITTTEQLVALAENKGSVFWDSGGYVRGYSAGFILNSSYQRITYALTHKSLFVYKKDIDARPKRNRKG